MNIAKRLDRLWWLTVLVLDLALFVIFLLTTRPEFSYLGRTDRAGRAALYSALAGVSAGLLGFSIAAVAILIAVPRTQQERFSRARNQTVSVLLSTSLLVAVTLVSSILGMVIDQDARAPAWLAASLVSSMISSLTGLAISGLSLAVLLRSVP
jgi:hypothetical protein